MSPVQAAIEHRRLLAELEAARKDGDGCWMREALQVLTNFIESRSLHPGSAKAIFRPTVVRDSGRPVQELHAIARVAGERSVGEWIEKASQRWGNDVMHALMKGGLAAMTTHAMTMFGPREAHNLLLHASDTGEVNANVNEASRGAQTLR